MLGAVRTSPRSFSTIVASLLSVASLLFLYSRSGDESPAAGDNLILHHTLSNEPEAWDSSRYIMGSPTERFKDNLRNDTYYITTWSNAGFTNQFIGYVNLIYLAIISGRIPIVAPFAPDHHIERDAGILPFGEIFNLTHLRTALRHPVLDWAKVKSLPPSTSPNPYSTSEIENIGCWSTRKGNDGNPIRAENLVEHLGLDVSYSRLPSFTRKNPSDGEDMHVVFDRLSAVIFPNHPIAPPATFPLMAPSPKGSQLPPEEQMSCFDVLYFMTSGAEVYEWRFAWSPAWRFVGKHVRFNEFLVDRARGYLRRAFGLNAEDELPAFIAVHIRRGDFASQCYDKPGDCLFPLSIYSRGVRAIQDQLFAKRNLSVSRIFVTSDEIDPGFWAGIAAMGWNHIDHEQERTLEQFGGWHAPLVDVVAQSLAAGFVGTEDSTFSLVSGRRVEDWNNGFHKIVTRGD